MGVSTHWSKFFGNSYQDCTKMTLGRVFAVLPHPQNPHLRPFLAMPQIVFIPLASRTVLLEQRAKARDYSKGSWQWAEQITQYVAISIMWLLFTCSVALQKARQIGHCPDIVRFAITTQIQWIWPDEQARWTDQGAHAHWPDEWARWVDGN